ncbi:MAG: hypothetical protein ACTSRY_03000 [Alphaproteobacteria bacterium]
MNSAKAIVIAGIAIGAAIVAGVALVKFSGNERPAYQLQRMEDGTTWRLDTRTGEVVACRLRDGRMICASSESATRLPRMSADEMADREERRERREQTDNMAMFDKFIELFERMIRLAREAEERAGPTATAPPSTSGSSSN